MTLQRRAVILISAGIVLALLSLVLGNWLLFGVNVGLIAINVWNYFVFKAHSQ